MKLQAKDATVWADERHWTVHCVRSSEWSTFHLHLCISYQCIWGWQHLPKPSPKCNFPKQNSIFFSLWGSTYDSADCWSAHRPPSARDSFKRVHDWCKAGWRRPGPPPNKNHAVNIHDRIFFIHASSTGQAYTLRFVESVLASKSVPVHRTDYGLGVLKSFRIRYHIGIFSFLQKPNFAAVT